MLIRKFVSQRALRRGLAVVAVTLTGLAAHAQNVSPVSYDMLNGNTGTYSYHDESYSGAGSPNLDNSPLSGGLGDLTDGVIATTNWNVAEQAVNGPYVGWTIDPLITFNFASVTQFQNVRIYFDDSGGFGGVSSPASVVINGTTFGITDPAGSEPFSNDFDLTSFAPTNTLAIQLNRSNSWVFASEFEFTAVGAGATAPEPTALALILPVSLPVVGMWTRRSRAASSR